MEQTFFFCIRPNDSLSSVPAASVLSESAQAE
jgi:hypothetical protein